jgi:hypothetical protein
LKKPKPLATFGKVEVHSAKFHPFESTRYLNIAALKKAPEAKIELGRIEGGGAEATIVMTVKRGMITGLAPVSCAGCGEATSKAKPARKSSATLKKSAQDALTYIRNHHPPKIKLPMALSRSSLGIVIIEIGPIVIFGGPFDICVVIIIDNRPCIFCLFTNHTGLCGLPL